MQDNQEVKKKKEKKKKNTTYNYYKNIRIMGVNIKRSNLKTY